MSIFTTLLRQITMMFIFVAIGYAFFKKSIISEEGNRNLGNILIWVSIPSLLLKAYMVPFTVQKMKDLSISFLLSACAFVIAIILSKVFCKRIGPVDEFSAAYANAGFMGIPLVQAVLGEDAIFFLSAYIALLNILQWSFGFYVISGRKTFPSPKKIFLNPIVVSVFVGILIFLLPFEVPNIVKEVVVLGAATTVPLSMLILGAYLAQTKLITLLTSKSLYVTSVVSLVIIPTVVALFLWFVPKAYSPIVMTVFIATATPVGSNAPILAELNGQNHGRAVQNVCQSTLLSILSLPFMIAQAARLLT